MASLKAIQYRVTIASLKCLESKGRVQLKSDLSQVFLNSNSDWKHLHHIFVVRRRWQSLALIVSFLVVLFAPTKSDQYKMLATGTTQFFY